MMSLTDFVVHNWQLFVALVIILILLGRTWIGPGAVTGIRPTDAVMLINREDAVVVDVRTDNEYREGHIMNSLHIPLGMIDSRISELKDMKSTPLIVTCKTGSRSSAAAAKLKKQGFQSVNNLSGGMLAWASANLPVTTEPTKSRQSTKKKSTKKPRAVGHDNTKEVVVYTTRRCPFCTRAIDLLEDKGVGYTEIRIDNKPELRREMEERAQRKTVPQIFIGDTYVGGCDDMYALEDQGELDGILGLTAKD